jgi:hypothetical protein
VYEFALAADMLQPGNGQAGGPVMTVTDGSGQMVLTLSVNAGQPAVTAARYLASRQYTVTYQYQSVSGSPAGAIEYSLFLLGVTDGVGPYAPDSTSGTGNPSGSSTTPSGGYTYTGSSTIRPSGNNNYF